MTAFRVESVVLGFGLVALGTVWTLSNLGRVDLLDTLHRWWPSILVAWGALELLQAGRRRASSPGGEKR